MELDLAGIVSDVVATHVPDPKHVNVPTVPGLLGHFDGDYMAYFAGTNQDPGNARRAYESRVARFKRVSGCETVVCHVTCGGSTKGERFLVAQSKPYQGNRKKSKTPLPSWQFCRDYMTDHKAGLFKTKIWRDREADDGVAYCATARAELGTLAPILANDKDFRMFPGIHYDWATWDPTVVPLGSYEVWGNNGLLYGHKWFWWQMIVGDDADNIQGLKGSGDAAAAKALEGTTDNTSAYTAVAALYEARRGEGWESHMVEQAALLWMRRDAAGSVLDFLSLGCWPDNIHTAAHALAARVADQRRALEALKE